MQMVAVNVLMMMMMMICNCEDDDVRLLWWRRRAKKKHTSWEKKINTGRKIPAYANHASMSEAVIYIPNSGQKEEKEEENSL